MADMKIDELNVLKELRAFRKGNFDAVSIETRALFEKLGVKSTAEIENYIYEWFSAMGLTAEDIENRARLACDFEDRFIETLITLYVAHENDEDADKSKMERWFFEDYGKAIEKFLSNKKEFSATDALDRKFTFSEDVANTTADNPAETHSYSEERALTMAVTESAVMLADADYKKALKQGCTQKSWNTIIDGREREWHFDADGQTVPIDEYFIVDGELMKHPHDPTASARNLVSCRCWCEYS